MFAHYCDSRMVGVPVNVTAEVYVAGERVAAVPMGPADALAPGDAWEMVQIRWLGNPPPLAEIVSAGSAAAVPMPDLCLLR